MLPTDFRPLRGLLGVAEWTAPDALLTGVCQYDLPLTYVTLTYPTTRSSFQLVVARGESFSRFIFQGFAMPSAAEKTLPLP